MSPRFAHVRGGGSRWWLLVAPWVLASVALTSGCSGPGPVDVTAPPSSADRVQAMCGDLIDELPETVADDLDARDVEPSDVLAAAWGDPAVVLRCGVPKPDALKRTSACFEVDWYSMFTSASGRMRCKWKFNGRCCRLSASSPSFLSSARFCRFC